MECQHKVLWGSTNDRDTKGTRNAPDCANRERDVGQLYGGDICDPISLIYSFAVGNLDSQLITG